MPRSRANELAKLQALRDSGALTDAEFEREKQAVLAAPARRWPLFAGLGAVALGATVALGIWSGREAGPEVAPSPVPSVSSSPPPVADARTPAARLADAFAAATGHREAFTQGADGEAVTETPLRIVDLPFGPALLTRREIKDGCHACTGSIGVYYLREAGGRTSVAGRYPEAVTGWGWGAAPDWELTTRFTANPAIHASGGYTGQGITATGATITELRPEGPVTSEMIDTGYDDSGAATDETGGVCELTGTIGAVIPDRSFEVVFAGSAAGRARYVNRDGRFVAERKVEVSSRCPGGGSGAG